jgi:hypothetical protein
MHINKVLRATTLALVVILASLLSCLTNNNVTAQPSAETTTLYFTKYNPINLEEDSENATQLSLTPPTTTKDSELPPAIFIKNESSGRLKLNSDELFIWIELWATFKFMNLSSLGLPDEFNELLGMFNPFKIQEEYTYTGEQPAEISDEILFKLYFSSNSGFLRHKDSVKVSIAKQKLFLDSFPIPEEIKNTTTTIKPTFIPGRIKLITINLNLDNKTIPLLTNDILVFSVEINPSERAISKLLNISEKLGFGDGDFLNKIADFLSKRKIDTLQQWGERY